MAKSPYDNLPVSESGTSSQAEISKKTNNFLPPSENIKEAIVEAKSVSTSGSEDPLATLNAYRDETTNNEIPVTPKNSVPEPAAQSAPQSAPQPAAQSSQHPAAQSETQPAAKSETPKNSVPEPAAQSAPQSAQQPAAKSETPKSSRPEPEKPVAPPLCMPLEEEAKYKITEIKNYGKATECLLPFEDSLIVPDTMADMSTILFTETKVTFSNPTKLTYKSSESVSGYITVYAVYQPTEGPIDVVKSVIPFKADECLQNISGDSYKITVSTRDISTEIINERKFTVKGHLAIRLLSLDSRRLSELNTPEDENLVVNTKQICATCLVDEIAHPIEISQEITLKDSQPEPVKILCDYSEVSELHRQITSGKLVINGVIRWQVLYLATEVISLSGKAEFTQFIPVNKNFNPSLLHITFDAQNLKITIGSANTIGSTNTIDSANKLLLSGNILTSVHCFENNTFNSTCDAYHKSQNLYFDVNHEPLSAVQDTVTGELSTREVINLDTSLRETNPVLAGNCEIIDLTAKASNNINIESEIAANILAFSDDDTPFTIHRKIPLKGSLELSANTTGISSVDSLSKHLTIAPIATIKEFWANAINSRQLEINVCLRITAWVAANEDFSTIEDLRFAIDECASKTPSLAIYVVSQQDTLWDVAKRYKTDITAIAELNELDPSQPLTPGTKLLISK